MAQGRFERQALLFNVTIGRVPDEAPPIEMPRVIAILRNLLNAGLTGQALADLDVDDSDDDKEQKGSKKKDSPPKRPGSALFIQEIRVDEDDETATILLHVADSEIADPAFLDLLRRRFSFPKS
jgi:hypothetical protein